MHCGVLCKYGCNRHPSLLCAPVPSEPAAVSVAVCVCCTAVITPLCAPVPSEPAALSVAVESEEKALLSWLPPEHSNGQLTSYSVYIRYCGGRGGKSITTW